MGYMCDYCGEQRSMVYCRSDAACLCLSCDRNVHSANALSRRHSRTLICERCNLQPAFVRCVEENLSLCQNCDWTGHTNASGHKRQAVNCYSGCPSADELSSIWSFLLELPLAADATCEKGIGSMSIADDGLANASGPSRRNNSRNSSVTMTDLENVNNSNEWKPSSMPQVDENLVDQQIKFTKSISSKLGAKELELREDDDFYEDFNMDELDLNIEKYEELFGVGHNDPQHLFNNNGIDSLFEMKGMTGANSISPGAYGAEGSLVGLENVVKPTDSNAASADSIRSCKTEPSGCFARQISNLSFSGVTGESSAGDYQDCCASSMLLMGEQQPWCPQGSESSLASDIRNSAVQRYKEKKKTRKFEKRVRYAILMLPSGSARQWHVHEMELVEVVADQVAVALSHAAILEESMRARDLLMEQNVALDLARREAETAIRARNDFLAVMNHEMRTPMHAIIALSSLLQETDLTPEQRLMVETILKSSNLLATLINDVLDLSRLEDGSLELDIGTFNLHALFREVFNLIKPIATVKKLFISLSLASDLPEFAIGDEKRLMQTILNVVGNAVKFSKEGSILISAFVAKPDSVRDPRAQDNFPMPADSNHFYLQVQVKDSGSGIDPQDIPKIFTKFAEGKALATNNSGGTGLGLAICKRFVHLMGGHIYLESEGIGKGCTAVFVVKLGYPQRLSDSKLPFAPGAMLPVSQGRTHFPGLKVLVMAENGVSRSVTKGLLVHLGCDITIVGSGDECLGALTPEHRVILLDMSVAGTDSYELAVLIREKYSTRHDRPFVVALTGTADRVMKENCMRVGMDGLVLKPFSVDKMRSVLSELLEHGCVFDVQ